MLGRDSPERCAFRRSKHRLNQKGPKVMSHTVQRAAGDREVNLHRVHVLLQ